MGSPYHKWAIHPKFAAFSTPTPLSLTRSVMVAGDDDLRQTMTPLSRAVAQWRRHALRLMLSTRLRRASWLKRATALARELAENL